MSATTQPKVVLEQTTPHIISVALTEPDTQRVDVEIEVGNASNSAYSITIEVERNGELLHVEENFTITENTTRTLVIHDTVPAEGTYEYCCEVTERVWLPV